MNVKVEWGLFLIGRLGTTLSYPAGESGGDSDHFSIIFCASSIPTIVYFNKLLQHVAAFYLHVSQTFEKLVFLISNLSDVCFENANANILFLNLKRQENNVEKCIYEGVAAKVNIKPKIFSSMLSRLNKL